MPHEVNPALTALRDAEADTYDGRLRACFLNGFNFAIQTLTTAAGEFDKQAAIEQAKHEDSDGYFGFLTGAEWQHSQMSARVGLTERLFIERTEQAMDLGKQKLALESRLAESQTELARVRDVCADLNREKNLTFQQSCLNLERANAAEARVKELEAELLLMQARD